MALGDAYAYKEDGSSNQQSQVVSTQVFSSTPTTGQTVNPTYTLRDALLSITPAGTLAALTVNLPNATLAPGQIVRASVSQIITALTLTATGGTIIRLVALTTLALGGSFAFQSDGTNWRQI